MGPLGPCRRECPCRSSDCTGAYVHAMLSDHPPAFLPQDPTDGGSVLLDERIPGESGELVGAEVTSVQPGSVPFVSHRVRAFGRLLLATYERMMTGGLSACHWLAPVTRGAWRVAPPISAG